MLRASTKEADGIDSRGLGPGLRLPLLVVWRLMEEYPAASRNSKTALPMNRLAGSICVSCGDPKEHKNLGRNPGLCNSYRLPLRSCLLICDEKIELPKSCPQTLPKQVPKNQEVGHDER